MYLYIQHPFLPSTESTPYRVDMFKIGRKKVLKNSKLGERIRKEKKQSGIIQNRRERESKSISKNKTSHKKAFLFFQRRICACNKTTNEKNKLGKR